MGPVINLPPWLGEFLLWLVPSKTWKSLEDRSDLTGTASTTLMDNNVGRLSVSYRKDSADV